MHTIKIDKEEWRERISKFRQKEVDDFLWRLTSLKPFRKQDEIFIRNLLIHRQEQINSEAGIIR